MNNMPELKIGVVAVSRDCFPESLSVSRREALMKAYKEKYGEEHIYECPICIVESEIPVSYTHLVQVSDEEAVSAQIDKAEEQNIPVITIRSDAPASKRVSFVSGNDYAIGEMYGNQINNIAQKKAEEEDRKIRVTVLLNSEERNAAPNVIFTAISETTASIASKIELTSKVIDNTGMFESEENVRDLIRCV